MGRPTKYDWDDKRDVCHKLYVDQNLSAGEIVQYFAQHFNVPASELPPTSQFRARFRKWGFPRRYDKLGKEEEAAVAARARELFEQHVGAEEMLKRLNDEGWELDTYHFRKIRRNNGMLIRAAKGYQPAPERTKRVWNKETQKMESTNKKRKRRDEDEAEGQEGEADGRADGDAVEEEAQQEDAAPTLTPEEAARRAQRLADLQLQSDHLLQTRKRRRRIRGYGHFGPDAPGSQPRYGSETSLDECKAFLHLTNDTYNKIRAEFTDICKSMGILKQTQCPPGQWQEAKDRLVRENSHLSAVLNPLQPELEKRTTALQCICADVTKRIRNEGKLMTIADAGNTLGISPIDSKELRRLLYEVLEEEHFVTMTLSGKEGYAEIERKWLDKAPTLQAALDSGDERKVKAVGVLARDARKRYIDDQGKMDPGRKHMQKYYGPGPGPAHSAPASKTDTAATTTGPGWSASVPAPAPAFGVAGSNIVAAEGGGARGRRKMPSLPPVGPAWQGVDPGAWRTSTVADNMPPIDFNLDPLLSATHGPPWPPARSPAQQQQQQGNGPPASKGILPHVDVSQDTANANTNTNAAQASIPAYFRLGPASNLTGHHPKFWLGKLSARTMGALRAAATAKAGAARVGKVQGIVRNDDDSEDAWVVERDEELEGYLEEVSERSAQATFVVVLEGGYA